MDGGQWTMDDGQWTVDYGPFHGHAVNHFVTSRIKHTPYQTFLVVYFLFLQLHHAINHFVASSSPNLDFDWPRRLFYLSTVHVSFRSCETKKVHFQRLAVYLKLLLCHRISHFVTCQLRNFLLVQLCHAIPLTSHKWTRFCAHPSSGSYRNVI